MATILIVDDLLANRKVLVTLLSHQGHRLLEEADGRAALTTIKAAHPDLVITDVLMPVMDGYELVRQLRLDPRTSRIPVVFYTAHYGEHEARTLALASGVSDVLTKPADADEVLKIVERVLSGTGRPLDTAPLETDFDREHLRLLTDKLSDKAVGLRAANARLRAVVNIGLELASERDSDGLLRKVCAAGRDLFGATYVMVGILDLNSRTVERIVSSGADTIPWIKTGEPVSGILGTVVAERRTLRGPSPGGSTGLQRPWLHPEVQAYLAAPIASPAQVYGWICCVGNEGRAFTEDDEQLALALAGQVGRIYENDHFYAVAQERAAQLESAIDERRQADAERRLLAERLSLATAVGRVGVWEWDLASNTLTWDATMFDIYGFSPVARMPYDRWSAAVCRDDLPVVEAGLRKAIDEKGEGSSEYRITVTDGSIKNISAVQRVVLDGSESVSRLIGVNMDVTKRKEAEQVLERSRQDQMRFKDAFLSHVSHELRSPLTAIKQFTSILQSGSAGAMNTEQQEYQEIVLRNIRQLQSMIDDLIEVTCLETGNLTLQRQSVSVSDAVTDALNTLQGSARDKGVTLSRDLPEDLPPAHADEIRLRQMLIILLDNAIKFTDARGAVKIHVRLMPQDPPFVLLEVSDTGCGISPEAAGKIFERLYQVSKSTSARKGLGLGLYICKELVTRQGGEIWVTSHQQRGSTFSFTLPVFSCNDVIAPPCRTTIGRQDRLPS